MVSFLGYNLVVVPFGLVLNAYVSRYDPNLVREAIVVTGIVTIVMTALGTAFPRFFRRIGLPLLVALVSIFLIEAFQIFIVGGDPAWIDWVVALIFCGYIGYDWGRANSIPKTVDNAVDAAAAIYMDIVNLFVRLLSRLDSDED